MKRVPVLSHMRGNVDLAALQNDSSIRECVLRQMEQACGRLGRFAEERVPLP